MQSSKSFGAEVAHSFGLSRSFGAEVAPLLSSSRSFGAEEMKPFVGRVSPSGLKRPFCRVGPSGLKWLKVFAWSVGTKEHVLYYVGGP